MDTIALDFKKIKEDSVKILPVNTKEHYGIKCRGSENLIRWDDEDIANAIEGFCILAVISSVCPENCAVGGLPLSAAWENHYARNSADSSLEEMIQTSDMDAVALQVISSGMTCSPYLETTYFLIPSDPLLTQLCSSNEVA